MDKNKDIKNEIMSKIEKGDIKMKSHWFCIAQKIGLQSGLALTVLILVFLLNAFFYYIKTNELLLSLHYGPSVWQKLLHSLPYDLILIIIFFLILLNFIIKKFDFSYKKPFILIFAIVLVFVIFFASVVFASNFNNILRIDLGKSNVEIPYIKDFYVNRCGCCH